MNPCIHQKRMRQPLGVSPTKHMAFGHIVTNIFGNEKKHALPANPSVVNLPDELGQVEEEKVQKPVEEEAG